MARILSIEDDAAIRRLLVAALSAAGHEMLEAGDGEAGLRMVREERPDLVLLDIGLPGLHGTAVLDRLKHDVDLASVPVIVVSAWGESVTAAMARKHGALDVIAKPFDVADLRARVAAVLERVSATTRPGRSASSPTSASPSTPTPAAPGPTAPSPSGGA